MGKRITFAARLHKESKRIAILLAFILLVVPALLHVFADSATQALGNLGTGNPAVRITQDCSAAVSSVADVNEKNTKFAECTRSKMAALSKHDASHLAPREPDARRAETNAPH